MGLALRVSETFKHIVSQIAILAQAGSSWLKLQSQSVFVVGYGYGFALRRASGTATLCESWMDFKIISATISLTTYSRS